MKPTFRKSYGPTPPSIVFVEIPKRDASAEIAFEAMQKAMQKAMRIEAYESLAPEHTSAASTSKDATDVSGVDVKKS